MLYIIYIREDDAGLRKPVCRTTTLPDHDLALTHPPICKSTLSESGISLIPMNGFASHNINIEA